eukprot:EG_transcript_48043
MSLREMRPIEKNDLRGHQTCLRGVWPWAARTGNFKLPHPAPMCRQTVQGGGLHRPTEGLSAIDGGGHQAIAAPRQDRGTVQQRPAKGWEAASGDGERGTL